MKSIYIYGVVILLVIVGLVFARNNSTGGGATRVTKYDDFAQCLTDKGARFFGAYWCPHCKEQKALFDNSNKLPYIECSTPNGQGQLEQCISENITGYPTWKFQNGDVVEKVMQFSELEEKTGCPVPQV
jgi:thiol-disulfide isomerase/thioredoxin